MTIRNFTNEQTFTTATIVDNSDLGHDFIVRIYLNECWDRENHLFKTLIDAELFAIERIG